MAWTFLLEDGTGLAASNSYASVAQGDDYHLSRLRSTVWTGAVTGDKEKALAQASRLIDAEMRFRGYKASDAQAMQWPRILARDRNLYGALVTPNSAGATFNEYFNATTIPKELREATCELARLLLGGERTDPEDTDGTGIKSLAIYKGVSVEFNGADRKKALPSVVVNMLAGLGTPISGGIGQATLVRK